MQNLGRSLPINFNQDEWCSAFGELKPPFFITSLDEKIEGDSNIVAPVLNLFGRCQKLTCNAFGQTVWMEKRMVSELDFGQERFKSSCPTCHQIAADVNGLIFWNCKFAIKGVKSAEEIVQEDKAPRENYTLFEPKSLMKKWSSLIVTTSPLDESETAIS